MNRSSRQIDAWRAYRADDDLRRTAVDLGYDDRGWPTITVPGHWRSTPAFADCDSPVLYRAGVHIDPPADHERVWLAFDGIFHQADVWFDGAYLGDPEGYFVPAAFDVTALARLAEEHVVAVEVSCPPVDRGDRRRTLTGAFQGGVALHPDWNPGGLWRPVRVERTGPVRIETCRMLCRDASAERAHVRLAVRLDSDRACRARVITRVDGVIATAQDHSLARGPNDLRWALDIDAPRLWWPWSLGSAELTEIEVSVELAGDTSDSIRRRTGLRQVDIDRWITRVNGERLFLKGVDVGPARRDLASADPIDLANDLLLARDAGFDLIRLRGHVGHPASYDAADELGLLIWQDLPLIGPAARSVRRRAVEQAEQVVDLLGHHPSILLWCAHDRPIEAASGVQRPTWNTAVLDRWVSRAFERADETRPVIAHAGLAPGTVGADRSDTHLDIGSGRRDVADLERLAARMPNLVRFVTGIGAPSVADSVVGDSPDALIDPGAWPRLDWARLAIRHGLDLTAIERHTPPADAPDADTWVEQTQRHQAIVLRRAIETLRRLKYRPTGGLCVSSLVDAEARVSTSLVDHLRRPKPAYAAVADACRPVIVVADLPPDEVTVGDALALEVHVVSDRRDTLSGALCTAAVTWTGGEHRWAWEGDIAADECTRIGMIRLIVPDAPGQATIDLTIVHDDMASTNRYDLLIARR